MLPNRRSFTSSKVLSINMSSPCYASVPHCEVVDIYINSYKKKFICQMSKISRVTGQQTIAKCWSSDVTVSRYPNAKRQQND